MPYLDAAQSDLDVVATPEGGHDARGTQALRGNRVRRDPGGHRRNHLAGARGRWKDYVEAIVKPEGIAMGEVRTPTERKTGVYGADVVTVHLVRDERGWLRMTG